MMNQEMIEQFLAHIPRKEAMSREEMERLYEFGFSLYGAEFFDRAADVFQMLCANRPLESKHWFGLAASLQRQGQYEKALSAWGMTAVLDSSNPYPHFHASECAFALEDEPQARLALDAALLRATEHPILRDRITLLKERWEEQNG